MKILLSLFYCLIALFPMIAHADDSAFGGNGIDVYPLQHSEIQLVSEVITISDNRVNGGQWSIHVTMFFKNHGPDAAVQMGFPLFTDDKIGSGLEI